MATTVVKKDGSIQPFDAEKMKGAIRGAATEAGLDATAVEETVAKVSEPVLAALAAKDQVATSEIKDLIFSQLQALNPSVIEAWNRHVAAKQA